MAVFKKQEMVANLVTFAETYSKLCELMEDIDINSLESVNLYPFEHSFDDYDKLVDWCTESAEEIGYSVYDDQKAIDSAKNQILSIAYRNTGGGIMVLVYKFVDIVTKRPHWLYVSDESWAILAVDYLVDEDYYDTERYEANDCIVDSGDSYEAAMNNPNNWLIRLALKDFDER